MPTVDILEHPSDVGFRAVGADLADAIDGSVLGLARIESGDAVPPATEERLAELDADDEETLVVALLEECLYLIDVHGWLAVGATRVGREGSSWRLTLRGAPLPDEARERGVHVKAVTYHQLAVERTARGVEITVFVDI